MKTNTIQNRLAFIALLSVSTLTIPAFAQDTEPNENRKPDIEKEEQRPEQTLRPDRQGPGPYRGDWEEREGRREGRRERPDVRPDRRERGPRARAMEQDRIRPDAEARRDRVQERRQQFQERPGGLVPGENRPRGRFQGQQEGQRPRPARRGQGFQGKPQCDCDCQAQGPRGPMQGYEQRPGNRGPFRTEMGRGAQERFEGNRNFRGPRGPVSGPDRGGAQMRRPLNDEFGPRGPFQGLHQRQGMGRRAEGFGPESRGENRWDQPERRGQYRDRE